MPVFLLFVLFEKWYGWKKKRETVRTMDMISSLSSGVTNVTKDVLGLSLVIVGYPLLVEKLALIHISNGILTYLIAFIALDFAGYWTHRVQHTVNLFWNGHIIHHSSEDFNLACALRQSISSIVKIFIIFLLPAALLGVPAEVIAVIAPLHLFAQFWYHTEHINKMGFLEKLIVTPSHHRVHHAFNKEYLDKNYGQIFIFWDKLFGSFQEELPDVQPVYGITRPVQTWNPIRINFQHISLLFKDAWRTRNWKDKILIWFKPTGYRPSDVIEKYPVRKIDDPFHFEKYEPKSSPLLHGWAWVLLISLLFFLSYLFGNIARINAIDNSYIYWYGLFIFLYVYSMTELMDRNPTAIFWSIACSVFMLTLIYLQGDWFGASAYSSSIAWFVAGFAVLQVLVSAIFVRKHRREDMSLQIS